jgi:hypothetical protein
VWTAAAAVYFPAALLASHVFSSSSSSTSSGNRSRASADQRQLFVLCAMLMQPALVLIDHGHFQYNCISLGLTVLAAVAIAKGRHALGSVLFSLALNHKQMTLFYAPAFFAHLLGRCLQQPTYKAKVRGPAAEPPVWGNQNHHCLCCSCCHVVVAGVPVAAMLLSASSALPRLAMLVILTVCCGNTNNNSLPCQR